MHPLASRPLRLLGSARFAPITTTWGLLLGTLGMVLSPESAQAEGPALPTPPQELAREGTPSVGDAPRSTAAEPAVGRIERYRIKTQAPESPVDTGGASIVLAAPLADVRSVITDYGHYADFIPAFQQARVLTKKAGESDVYLQVPIAHGAASLWGVVHLSKPVPHPGGGETVRGTFLKGNVSDFRAAWHLIPLSESRTQLQLELLVVPQLPLPASLLTGYLEGAAARAIAGVQKRLLGAQAGPIASRSGGDPPDLLKSEPAKP